MSDKKNLTEDELLEEITSTEYKYGFTTDIKSDKIPKGLSEGLKAYSEEVECQALALDHYVDRRWAADNLRNDLVLQGNLDPLCLVSGGQVMKREVEEILEVFSNRRHIFNLGHGIVPQTPPEHVSELLALIRG